MAVKSKTNPILVLLVSLVLLCTAFIFSNSLKDSAASHADSDVIVGVVEKVADRIKPGNGLDWSYIVRKGAHLFEFFVLGTLTMILSECIERRRWRAIIYALLYVLAVASADEFIQSFTGRTSSFTDVLIDMLGAVIGIGLVMLMRLFLLE